MYICISFPFMLELMDAILLEIALNVSEAASDADRSRSFGVVGVSVVSVL